MKVFIAKALSAICMLLLSAPIYSSSYYIAPDQSSDENSGTSEQAPWASFEHALSKMQAGDTLYLMDGVYHQTLDISLSGTHEAPVTIKALNDGKALIDGQGVRETVILRGSPDNKISHLVLEGFVASNSYKHVYRIRNAQHIVLKRLSGSNAVRIDKNNHIFSIAYSTDVLVEDCAAYGTARILFDYYGSQRGTFRRCWGRWKANTYGKVRTGITCYGSGDCLVENCIMTVEPNVAVRVEGIKVNRRDGNPYGSRNRFYGNIAYGFVADGSPGYMIQGNEVMDDNEFINNASIGNSVGFYQRNDRDLRIQNMTIAECLEEGFKQVPYCRNKPAIECEWDVNADIRNTSIVKASTGIEQSDDPIMLPSVCDRADMYSTLSQSWNNLYGLKKGYSGPQAEKGDLALDPGYDTELYGKGAYLIVPDALIGKGEDGEDIGAEILFRYVDSELTNDPLWPWPMEERIFSETGTSVTYERYGGIWKTLPQDLAKLRSSSRRSIALSLEPALLGP